MDLRRLYAELEKVHHEKECFRDNMFGDRGFVEMNGSSNDPWDQWECNRLRHYLLDDGKIYSQMVNRELRLRKLIARQEKQYAWSTRRFKTE